MIKEYGYEYNAVVNNELLSQCEWKGTDKKFWGAYSLRSGRDALKVIAREHPNSTVYLPSLCCDSMITPFELYDCKIVFYPLTDELCVDYIKLSKILENSAACSILLFYDYFGIKMFETTQLIEIKKKYCDLILVRDITHNLLCFNELDIDVDYTIASLRKWTNIPDGGLLWTNHKLQNTQFFENSAFAKQRLKAQCLRTEFFETGSEVTKEKYRKIFSEVSALLDEDKTPIKMSEYSYEISANTDWEDIKKIRRDNAEILYEIFSGCEGIRLINSITDESNLYVPIMLKNRDEVQSRLSKQGIFNTIIWPLREMQISSCENTACVGEHMLAVPCDQRYTKEDMSYIGTEIVRAINE